MRPEGFWPSARRWPSVYSRATISCMDVKDGRPALVPAALLDDLLETVRYAVENGLIDDPVLSDALRGSVAAVRIQAILEP